jgi:hypothetical protein
LDMAQNRTKEVFLFSLPLVLPFGPLTLITLHSYIHESSTLAKAYGMKVWCNWEHPREHIGSLMGTEWEFIGNIPKESPPQNPKERKQASLKACLAFWLATRKLWS